MPCSDQQCAPMQPEPVVEARAPAEAEQLQQL
jgi:hypothetical protein